MFFHACCHVWPQLLKYMGSHSYCTCWAFSLWCKCLICHQTLTQRCHQKSHVRYEWRKWDCHWNVSFLQLRSCDFTSMSLLFNCDMVPEYNSHVIWMQHKPRRLSVYLAGWVVGPGRRSSAHFRKSIDTPWGQQLTEAGSLALPCLLYSLRSNLLWISFMKRDHFSSLSFTDSLIGSSCLVALPPSHLWATKGEVWIFSPGSRRKNVPVQMNKPFSKRALSLCPAHTVPEIPLA